MRRIFNALPSIIPSLYKLEFNLIPIFKLTFYIKLVINILTFNKLYKYKLYKLITKTFRYVTVV